MQTAAHPHDHSYELSDKLLNEKYNRANNQVLMQNFIH